MLLSSRPPHIAAKCNFRTKNARSKYILTPLVVVVSCSCRRRHHQLRICWYLLLAAAEDEETQKRGVVIVLYDVGQHSDHHGSSYNLNSASKIPALKTWSVPLLVTAIHVCYSRSTFEPFLALGAMMCEKHSRARLRIHNSGEECSCCSLF